jgi:ribosomal protein L7/L12
VSGFPTDRTAEEDPEIRTAIEDGNLIPAIKRYREVTGAGLKEAKEAVEAIRARMGPSDRT